MDETDYLVSIFKALLLEAKPMINIVSLVKDLVDNGILKDCDALIQNAEADVELLISKLIPQLLNNECRVACLSIMENHGVCCHNLIQLMQCITDERELPLCCQEPTLCIRPQDHSHGRAESRKVLRLPGGPLKINTGTTSMFEESSTQVISHNFINNPIHKKNSDKAIDSCQLTTKPATKRQTSVREYLRNKIIGNWKYIKSNISLDSFAEKCLNEDLLDFNDVEKYNELPKSQKIDAVLTAIVRNIDDASDFDKFLKVLDKDEHEHHIADKLKEAAQPGWVNDEILIEQCKHRLKENRKLLEREIRPEKCVDDFLEGFILDLDEHEEILQLRGQRKKMAEFLFDKVLSSVEKGSFNVLMKVLEQQIPKRFKRIFETLECTSDFKVERKNETAASLELQHGICSDQIDDSKELSVKLTLKISPHNKEYEKTVMKNFRKSAPQFLKELYVYPSEIKEGSVVVRLDPVSGEWIVKLKNSVMNGDFVKILEALFNSDDIKKCLLPGYSCIEVSIAVDRKQSSEGKSSIHVSQDIEQDSVLSASKKLLLEEIDPLTLLDGFTKRNCDIFESSEFHQIKTKTERTNTFIEILRAEEERYFDLFLEVLEEKKMLFVLRVLKLWRQVRLADISVLRQNILQNISEIADELYIDDLQEELMERKILSEEVFEDLSLKFPDNIQHQVIELVVDLLKLGRTSYLIDIMLLNGMDVLVSKLLIPEKETGLEVKDDNVCQGNVVVCGKDLSEGVLFEGVIKMNVIVTTNIVQQINTSQEDILRRFENSSTKLENMIGILSQGLTNLTGLKNEVLQQVDHLQCSGNSSTLDLEASNKGLDLIDNTISKFWNTKGKTVTLSAIENIELTEAFNKVQFLLSKCQTKPEIEECGKTSTLEPVDDYNSKFSDVNSDSQTTEKQESSFRDALVKSNPISVECKKLRRSVKRQISQTKFEILPEITIRTLDGSLTYVKEKRIPIDSEGNISMTEFHDIDTKEKGITEKANTENGSDNLSTTKGASSKVNFKDILRVRMTEKGWKELCEIEIERGERLSLDELPQVCAPDTILLLDLSGSMKGTAFIDMKAAVHDFLDKRIATREELKLNENIAMVIFGYKTEVRHHLTSDYNIVRQRLDTLPEPGGPSPLIPGLKLCQAVVAARGKISILGGRQHGSRFHPRILLLSDGNLTPSECVIGNKYLEDLNTAKEDAETEMISDLYNVCRELQQQKIQIVCIPVGCINEPRLQFIAETTNGKVLTVDKADTLGNERMKMVYAKALKSGSLSEDELKSKLLSLSSISANDYDDIKDMSENPEKYGIINEEDNSVESEEETEAY
ncbi:unnamed protein product [Mytilus coruscus]|uniref:VWFA domain-containing protein n=1 Tax=Mytilus coruscus TaxID=42192 RepID=A0A6J8C872_MYTCO|nr:unnamed protein product [Mytilus coruscus]